MIYYREGEVFGHAEEDSAAQDCLLVLAVMEGEGSVRFWRMC